MLPGRTFRGGTGESLARLCPAHPKALERPGPLSLKLLLDLFPEKYNQLAPWGSRGSSGVAESF